MNGLVLAPIGVALYFGALFLWSALLAYILVFGKLNANRHQKGQVDRKPEAHTAHAHDSHKKGHGDAHGHHAPPKPPPPPPKPFRGYSEYEGFKSFATGDTLTIEDIVKGLARESGAQAIHEAEVAEDTAGNHDGKEHVHEAVPAQSAEANEFLRFLVDGEKDAAHEKLREIEEHGEGAEPFLRRVLTAVENALNARLNNGTCDLGTMEVLGSCDTPVLERLSRALADGKHGGKLALTRAFNALQ